MFDFHQSFVNDDGEYDEDRIQSYVDGLMATFNASAEAQLLRDRQNWAQPMMEFGFDRVGVSPAEMTPRDFEEILFELFPRKVSTEADQAESILTELRAFWTFAARQFAAVNSTAILAVLDDSAVVRLRAELSNPANFGMAKSMFILGSRSGFDMTSDEGLAAFMTAYNASLQTGPKESPAMRHQWSESLKKKRKDKRKQRQAKKKNRSR